MRPTHEYGTTSRSWFGWLVTIMAVVSIAKEPLWAQFEVAAHGGVHFDRSDRPDRFLASSDGDRLDAAAGEASVWGGRAGYWIRSRVGIQADYSHSHNESWTGTSSVPPLDFANTTTYLSVRAVLRTDPLRTLQLFGAAGPALLVHGGTGTSNLARGTDPGGVLEVGGRVRLSGRLGFQLAVSNYLYVSRYNQPSGTGGGNSDFRHDVLVLPGLTWSWR